jgi:hypothetical protein
MAEAVHIVVNLEDATVAAFPAGYLAEEFVAAEAEWRDWTYQEIPVSHDHTDYHGPAGH